MQNGASLRKILSIQPEPLEDWEEEACRKRVPILNELSVLAEDPRRDLLFVKSLTDRLMQPLRSPEGAAVKLAPKHLRLILDLSMQQRIFRTEAELKRAEAETASYFQDGKPFLAARWLDMMSDMAASRLLKAAGRLN